MSDDPAALRERLLAELERNPDTSSVNGVEVWSYALEALDGPQHLLIDQLVRLACGS